MDTPAAQQRQMHTSCTMQKNAETPTKQSPDKVVDVTTDMASPSATVEGARKMVEVARVSPHELVKPTGERTSVRERVRQLEVDGGVSRTSIVGCFPSIVMTEATTSNAPTRVTSHGSCCSPHSPPPERTHQTKPTLRDNRVLLPSINTMLFGHVERLCPIRKLGARIHVCVAL